MKIGAYTVVGIVGLVCGGAAGRAWWGTQLDESRSAPPIQAMPALRSTTYDDLVGLFAADCAEEIVTKIDSLDTAQLERVYLEAIATFSPSDSVQSQIIECVLERWVAVAPDAVAKMIAGADAMELHYSLIRGAIMALAAEHPKIAIDTVNELPEDTRRGLAPALLDGLLENSPDNAMRLALSASSSRHHSFPFSIPASPNGTALCQPRPSAASAWVLVGGNDEHQRCGPTNRLSRRIAPPSSGLYGMEIAAPGRWPGLT